MAEERQRGERESHMANKQMGRHMDKAFGGKETPKEESMEHGHESFHVFKHAGGAHSVHHHMGGVEHADHASTDEAMDHGKMAIGGQHPAGEMPPTPPEGEPQEW
jgi:hypothetical protein